MREKGIITKVLRGKVVEVVFKRTESCGKCHQCDDLPEGQMAVRAINEIGAPVGGRVEVEIPSEEIVKGSLIVFLLPVIFLLAGFFLATKVLGLSELNGILLGLLSLILSGYVIMWYDRRIERRSVPRARILNLL